jgi:hypothetical protein
MSSAVSAKYGEDKSAELLLLCHRLLIHPESVHRIGELLTDSIDWDGLLLTASHHGSLGLLNSVVHEHRQLVPPKYAEDLQDCARRIRERNQHLAGELEEIQTVLRQAQIETAAFDGPVMTHLYPDTSFREAKSISLLVGRKQVLKAKEILLDRDYRSEYTWDAARERAELRFRRAIGLNRAEDGIHVWLYTALDPGCFSPEAELARTEIGQVSLTPGKPLQSLSLPDALLHSAVVINEWAFSPRLWLISDFAQLVRAFERRDYERLLMRARRFGVMRRLLAAFQVANEVLWLEVPPMISAALEKNQEAIGLAHTIMSRLWMPQRPPSRRERMREASKSRERTTDRARLLAHSFLSPTREDWSLAPLPALMYFLVKPFRLAAKLAGWKPKYRLAVFMPTPLAVAEAMLQLAQAGPDDTVYDLGCGDGRIVILAAQRHGAKGVGIDLDPKRIEEAKARARAAAVDHLVSFFQRDLNDVDLSGAQVVCLFLSPQANLLIRPKLQRELPPGARIVSRSHDMGDWQPERTKLVTADGSPSRLYLWKTGGPAG